MRQDWTCNSLAENSSRSVRELSIEQRKDLSLRVISCGLMFQEVRWLPSRRFYGVRLTADSSARRNKNTTRNLKRLVLGPLLRTRLRNKGHFLNEEKRDKKSYFCGTAQRPVEFTLSSFPSQF